VASLRFTAAAVAVAELSDLRVAGRTTQLSLLEAKRGMVASFPSIALSTRRREFSASRKLGLGT
jgi:hypothetical protein